MGLKIAWAITGAGDYLQESFAVMKRAVKEFDLQLMVFLSRAGLKVVKWYKLLPDLEALDPTYHVEEDANTPFIINVLQRRKYELIVVMPATANTTAKLAYGIGDSLITNAVAQAQKAAVPVYIYPVDQKPGRITTILPSGEELTLTTRKVDLDNVERLRAMEGMRVLEHPRELLDILKKFT